MLNIDESEMRIYFGSRLQTDVRLARFTTSRVGGPVRWFVDSNNARQLSLDARYLWDHDIPFRVLGNGSNVLVSERGWEGVILHNQAKAIFFAGTSAQPLMISESGATLSAFVRASQEKGLSGMEWAAGIPGTIGGAVYGNAGARGSDISQVLVLAEILHREKGTLSLTGDQMGYQYRSSALKRDPGQAIILSASFQMVSSTPSLVREKVDEYNEKRRNSQPAGASFGSTFKNPAGDYAGRLIEAAGLKGTKIGGVEVSPVHGNFLINDGSASSEDYYQLISLVRETVKKQFSIELELEIELLGDWQDA